MEVDDLTQSPEFAEDGRRARRRLWAQQAVTLAMQSRWGEAVEMNRRIVELVADDAEAYNRLGKAYTELGQIHEAREAYGQSLQADPANLIAQRNLDRLSRINDTEAAELALRAGHKLDPSFFMEETGKTGVTELLDVADDAVLATLTGGDQITLTVRDGKLVVESMEGTYLGRVEDRVATRLMRLMQSGNQYKGGVVGADADRGLLRVILREMYQAPDNVGRISFPPRVNQEALPRPYLREGLLRRASAASDDEDEDEMDVDLADVDAEEDEEESGDFGFGEGGLDER